MDGDQRVGHLRIELDEAAVATDAGVVDQEIERRGGGAVGDGVDARVAGQIGDQDFDLGLVRGAEALGERLQPIAAAGDDDEVVAAGRQLLGKGLSDAGGGAGDESEGT